MSVGTMKYQTISSFDEEDEFFFGIHVNTKPKKKKEKRFEEGFLDQGNQAESLLIFGTPLKLESLVNSLIHEENMLNHAVEFYNQVGKEDRKKIILAIIQYVKILEVSWDFFKKNVPKKMYRSLMKRREKVVNLEEKMRSQACKKIGSSLSIDDLENLKMICANEFQMKKRVNTLMIKDKKKIKKLQKETIQAIRKIAENYGMISAQPSNFEP